MAYPGIDTKEAVMFGTLFASITDQDKNLVIGYLSALNDKAVADRKMEQDKRAQTA